MVRRIDHNKMGKSKKGWLNSIFHFSFAEYYNPDNIHFGTLRVINDDLVEAGTGFETHPHQNMEIVSYVVDGELTHGDSMGNKNTLKRGEVQYMSAGTGVYHSEFNLGDKTARFLQIWIMPDKAGHTPNYGDYKFAWEDRESRWLQIVAGSKGEAPIKIHQDANLYVTELKPNEEIDFEVGFGRQAYLVQIEGSSIINDEEMSSKDGLEAAEESLHIKALEKSHILVIEMKK
ncbi:pirin family protein [Konateibacter massiliensis]|uniref:pirin family protein n=1 Tax=Konateibacter massiliensis TaxID=2002841 RepID=UPI000C15287D|nr:pirin family protein [Konateibacter massiliensis]